MILYTFTTTGVHGASQGSNPSGPNFFTSVALGGHTFDNFLVSVVYRPFHSSFGIYFTSGLVAGHNINKPPSPDFASQPSAAPADAYVHPRAHRILECGARGPQHDLGVAEGALDQLNASVDGQVFPFNRRNCLCAVLFFLRMNERCLGKWGSVGYLEAD